MAYQANIPQPNNLLSQSQDDILNNFQAIQTLIGINHVNFGAADQGKHKWLSLPEQAATPPAGSAFGATELGLYNAVYGFTAKDELYINKTNQTTVVQVPMTASILSTNSAPAAGAQGWSYLPSGLIIKWGNMNGTGSTVVDISGIGPAYTNILSIYLTIDNALVSDVDIAVRLRNVISPTQFGAWVSPRTTLGSATANFLWLTIGY